MGFTGTSLQAITAFAAQLGLGQVRPARDGSYGFQFSRAGRLSITPSRPAGRAIVSLARDVPPADTARLSRLLDAAGFDASTNRIVYAGLASEGTAHLALDFDERDLSAAALDAALEQLAALHDRAA